jgi:hypothetical protein
MHQLINRFVHILVRCVPLLFLKTLIFLRLPALCQFFASSFSVLILTCSSANLFFIVQFPFKVDWTQNLSAAVYWGQVNANLREKS